MDGIYDPVDSSILADSLVLWVNENDFEVLVSGILVDPVRIEDTEICAAAADSFFGGGAEGALVLELVHTLVGGFACGVIISITVQPATSDVIFCTVGSTLWHRLLATTSSDTDSVNDIALFCFVSKTTSLVRSLRT